MIRINRGTEPAPLAPIRATQLNALRGLGRSPTSDDIVGYRVVSKELWRAQHYKCCYCEHKIPQHYNDVEHYRPKARAEREPGCLKTHGYWWLAYTWNNLLFACPSCNRSAKNSRFPTAAGSITLGPEDVAPGAEVALLLDPGSLINPVEHIQFLQNISAAREFVNDWWARPRGGSLFGQFTIEVCDINNVERRELRQDYFETTVVKRVSQLLDAISRNKSKQVRTQFENALDLLEPKTQYVAFAFDAMSALVPDSMLQASVPTLAWPLPHQIGL